MKNNYPGIYNTHAREGLVLLPLGLHGFFLGTTENESGRKKKEPCSVISLFHGTNQLMSCCFPYVSSERKRKNKSYPI